MRPTILTGLNAMFVDGKKCRLPLHLPKEITRPAKPKTAMELGMIARIAMTDMSQENVQKIHVGAMGMGRMDLWPVQFVMVREVFHAR